MPGESGMERQAKTNQLGPGPQGADGSRPEPPVCTLAGLSVRDPGLAQLLRPLGPLDRLAAQPQTPTTHLSPLTQVAAGLAEQWRKDDVRSAFPTPGSAQPGSEAHPIDAELL